MGYPHAGSGTTLWSDDVWVVDSTPVERGRSRETAKRSDLAGWAQYGYCASHTRYFWDCGCTWFAPRTAFLSPSLGELAGQERTVVRQPHGPHLQITRTM